MFIIKSHFSLFALTNLMGILILTPIPQLMEIFLFFIGGCIFIKLILPFPLFKLCSPTPNEGELAQFKAGTRVTGYVFFCLFSPKSLGSGV
jgi:hypothetical protein